MKHRIFKKGDYIYGLLSSRSKPESLIPVRGVIMDTKWDPVNPKYKIKILKFYDNILYLKKYFFGTNFNRTFKRSSIGPLPLKKEDYPTVVSLENRLHSSDAERFYVVIDSIMCVKTLQELRVLYDDIHFYLISKRLKEIKEISIRSFYRGVFSLSSIHEFNMKMKVGWKDHFDKNDFNIDKYLDSLS